jgi:hypothetical protein
MSSSFRATRNTRLANPKNTLTSKQIGAAWFFGARFDLAFAQLKEGLSSITNSNLGLQANHADKVVASVSSAAKSVTSAYAGRHGEL